jgi:hypothetical protein
MVDCVTEQGGESASPRFFIFFVNVSGFVHKER